jgi:site-specific DNA-methyltransferase (adenine-specific)
MSEITLHVGDNRLSLRRLIDQGVRVHSVVTDPPYNLQSITKRFGKSDAAPARTDNNDGSFARLSGGFMGMKWDATGIERDPEFWKLVYDILLPGGYVFAFSGARTGHWQAVAMEQAGFIHHPMHGWAYGSGWPKPTYVKDIPGWEGHGYGTQAQKPALEPIYLCQKPFSEKTGPLNILKHGVGAVNINDCRVPAPGEEVSNHARSAEAAISKGKYGDSRAQETHQTEGQKDGRSPSNLILDGSPEVVALFPNGKSGKPGVMRKGRNDSATYGAESRAPGTQMSGYGDEGSNARFFHHFAPTEEDYQWAIDAGVISEDQGDCLIYHAKANKHDRAGSKHPCLLPGEEVLTENGFRAIENLTVGEKVLSDDGTFREIIDHFESPADTTTYRIHIKGSNQSTEVTDNHPYFIWRPSNKKHPFKNGQMLWVDAADIRIGDYTVTPVVREPESDGSEDLIWWHIFGLWVAEGCKLSGSNGSEYPSLTIAKARNADLLPVIEQRFESVSAYDRASAWQVVIFEAGLIDRFVELAGYSAKGKFISSEILRQPAWARKAFLEGYLRGDGCIVRGAYRASTASDDLAATLPLLAASLGIKCATYKYDVTGVDSQIEGRVIPGGIVYKMYFSADNQITVDGRRYRLHRVKQVESRKYRGSVWNITVAERHTFQTRSGMSHNTVKPIGLLQYLIRHITPVGGTVLDMFAGSGTTAEAARREGRDCILMEAEKKYVDFIHARFRLPHTQGVDQNKNIGIYSFADLLGIDEEGTEPRREEHDEELLIGKLDGATEEGLSDLVPSSGASTSGNDFADLLV